MCNLLNYVQFGLSVVVLKWLRYFAHFQVIIAKKISIETITTGQMNIAVSGEYLPQRFSSHNHW